MDSFEFKSPTKFILEKDADKLCGKEIKSISNNVLFVHYGDDYTYNSGLHERIVSSLKEAGVATFELPGVEPNPKVELVRKGIEICKQHNIKYVLAVGGGSVIDTAKAVALGAKYDGDVWDFFEKKVIPKDALPIGTVMTLPATGSEGSNGTVIKNNELGESADVMTEYIRPTFTLMNPDLTLTIPLKQTVFGIVDMFSHVMERYFSNSVDVVLTDYLCEGVMKSILVNANKLMNNMNDYNTRAEFMWTAIIAHNGILATGRNQDWATHSIAAQISAQYNSVHGATLSVLLPNWGKYVYKANLTRFVQFANRVFDVDIDFYDQERTALEGIKRLKQFFKYLGAPTTLSEIGIKTDEEFNKIAKKACKFGNIGCIKNLDSNDVIEILKMSM